MLECLILGDSIAVGISQFRSECQAIAKVGITSTAFIKQNPNIPESNNTIISLGTNDSTNTLENLIKLRESIKGKVYWIMPPRAKQKQRDIVISLASKYNDVAIGTDKLSPDNIHPTTVGYKGLAHATK